MACWAVGFEPRDLRRGRRHVGVGVGHVQGAREPHGPPLPGDLGGVLLGLQVVLSDHDLLLRPAELHVIEPHFGHEADLDVAKAFHGRLDVRGSRLDIAAHPAEHVQFPDGVQTGLEEIRSAVIRGEPGRMPALVRSGRGDGRPEPPDGDPPGGTGLAEAGLGELKVEVRHHRRLD